MEDAFQCRYEFFTSLPKDAAFIREEVFVKEQGFCNEFDDIDKRAIHLVIYIEGKPAGTGRTFVDDKNSSNVYTIGRLAVLKAYRKEHLGSRLMNLLEAKIQELGGKKIVLSAQCRVRHFYESLGYQASGEIYLDEYCPHIHMEKLL